jgi:L-ascorbate metabolism protein UlaG (beta-lactamase superfamily)
MGTHFGVSIKWLAVTCFEIRAEGVSVVTDPFVTDCESTDLTWEAIENCDIICLSHPHFDHITDIPPLLEKFHPLLLCGDQTAMPMVNWLGYNPSRTYPMYPNMELDFDTIKIRALYGRHTDQKKGYHELVESLGKYRICAEDPVINAMQGLGSMEYRNFFFTLPNGTKILLWGNDPTPEQTNLCKALQPDIAIIQRSSDPAGIQKKAEFAAAIGCKVLIPHHHDFKTPEKPETIELFREEFLKRVPEGIFLNPVHGQWMHL